MKHWILAAATLILVQGVDAREHWGPPPVCPQPKVDCCPKPKCPPPCPPKPCPKPCPPKACKPKPCKPQCRPKPDPCCPPVCFERGFPSECCIPSAYSEPAAIELRCGYDLFFTASFLYWEAQQGGMDLALPGEATISAAGVLTELTQPAVGHSILKQSFKYKPGFQLGFGWTGAVDNWVLYAQYTWLHGSTLTSQTAPDPGVATINGNPLPQNGVWIPTSWFPGVYNNNATTHITSKWKYKIDLVDAQMSRPFYSGTRFLVEPFFGLRGAWIRQHMSLHANIVPTPDVQAPTRERAAHYSSVSRAVGPRVGMNGNWHLGYGIRFMGNAAASLLLTGYDVKQNVGSPDTVTGLNPFPLRTKINNLNGLRPNLDMSLGLGWGSYFACRRVHWDLAATYDFNIFWEQNMMRYLADLTADTTAHPDGAASNLFLHGLTIKTSLDF